MALRLAIAVIGLIELFYPRQLVDWWMKLAAKEDTRIELRPWVYTAARIEGVIILLWILFRHEDH